MVRRIGVLVVAMTVAMFVAVNLSPAQEMKKKEGDQKGMTKGAEKKMADKKMAEKKAAMMEGATLKEFSCGDECGYSVRSRDEAEVLDAAEHHVKKHHSSMKVSEKDIKAMIKDVK